MVATTSALPPAGSLHELRARIQHDPADGPAWLALALLLAERKPGQELRLALAKSIELMPDDYQAWLLAGMEVQQRQGPDAAQQWLRRIAQQKPKLPAPRLASAQLLSASRPQEAEEKFLSLIEAFPGDARACLLLAELLQNQGKPGSAADYLEKALKLRPEVVSNWAALAMLRLAQGRLDAVVSAASRALDLDPDEPGPRLTRAEAYRQAAQWQLALDDYRRVLIDMPGNPYILLGIGACLAGQGEFGESLQMLGKALQIKPDLLEARLNIALVLASQAKAQLAMDTLAVVLRNPDLPAHLRESALLTQAILQEHLRLRPFLLAAVQSAEINGFQTALLQAPAVLRQRDAGAEEILHRLAAASQKVIYPSLAKDPSVHPGHLAFVEACLLARAADEAADMAALWWQIQQNPSELPSDPVTAKVYRAWQSVRDRRQGSVAAIKEHTGEAWLRYWHYRLAEDSPLYLPGMFKIAPNSIGLHATVAPQHLITSCSTLMNEIHPSLPAGMGRALFMLSAISRIHAFVDGNGRLSRFVFSWELEQAGLSVLLFVPSMRRTLAVCLDRAQYSDDFSDFADQLETLTRQTRVLVKQFSERLGNKIPTS